MLILGVFVNPAGALSGVIQGDDSGWGGPSNILYYPGLYGASLPERHT